MLGVPDRLAVEGQQRFLEARRAVRLVGDEQDTPSRDREGAQVERLVVQDAESQAIVFGLRAARLVPANVSGVQGDRHRAEPDVEAADGAAVLVGFQHPLAESPDRAFRRVTAVSSVNPTAFRMSGWSDSGKCRSRIRLEIAAATIPGSAVRAA